MNQSFNRTVPKLAFPLPVPPKIDKVQEGLKTNNYKARVSSTDDRVASLKAYRTDRGLCDKCAEKWKHGNKCADTFQLHVPQELWEMFGDDFAVSEEVESPKDSPEQLYMAISPEVVSGKQTTKTFQLKGTIQGQPMLILLDSRSSHTFLCAAVAQNLSRVQKLSSPLKVQVANGNQLQCD